MAKFPSLGAGATVPDILKMSPEAGKALLELHEAIMVICCFNFMNRLLEGHGVHGHEALFQERGPMLKKYGYLPLIRLLGVGR